MGTQKTSITDSLSGVLELTEPHNVQRRITAIDLTMPEDRDMAPDTKKSKNSTENSKDAPTEIKGSLSSLNLLPAEIMIIIISAMEFRSLAAFRHVNSYAREMVESVTKFEAIKRHAPLFLRAAINLNPPLPASILTLNSSLLEKGCCCCDIRDGSIISLLDCRRYCRTCFSWSSDRDQFIWCYGAMARPAAESYGNARHGTPHRWYVYYL